MPTNGEKSRTSSSISSADARPVNSVPDDAVPPNAVPPRIPGQIAPEKATIETITWIRSWTPHLFSFRITRPAGFRFAAGQFARLGVFRDDTNGSNDGPRYVWRAYSIVSAEHDEFLEFYSIVVPDGDFTTRLATLKVGDEILVEKTQYGFLTLDRFEQGKDLWMLSSGTGIAPFLSMLFDLSAWQQYERLIIVHSVREVDELAYRDTIEQLAAHEYFGELLAADPGKLVYVPIITRERGTLADGTPMLGTRITAALADGSLEAAAGVKLDLARSRIMICGNPAMVDDVRKQLVKAGFAVSRRARPAQIAVENYW
ncbi:ferredoxin--NADP reductase [soil metagenome]